MRSFVSELRFASRRLLAIRWTAAAAITVIALGNGLNTGVFAIGYGVLLRPLPYADANRLLVVNADVRFQAIGAWRQALSTVSVVGAYAKEPLIARGIGEPRLLRIAFVDDGFFETLGTVPERGRVLTRGDSGAGAVVSERFAHSTGTPPDALLGRAITIGETPVSIIGVMPRSFAVPSEDTDAWVSARDAPAIVFDWSKDARRFQLIARLSPGVPLSSARADFGRVANAMDSRRRDPLDVAVLPDTLRSSAKPVLMAFEAGTFLVFLMACANVATILVGRTIARGRELAIRRAVGASASHLYVTLLSESLIITAVGTAAGLAIADLAVRVFRDWAKTIVPMLDSVRFDWRVVAFAVIAMTAATLMAAVPALRSMGRMPTVLRTTGEYTSVAGRRTRSALVATQIAMAVVLLAGAGLLTRTLTSLLSSDAGIDTRDAITSQLMLTGGFSFNAADRGPVMRQALDRIRSLPSVAAAGCGSSLPPNKASLEMDARIVDQTGEHTYTFSLASATPGYLPAVGARLIAGRDFTDADRETERAVVILSETAARELMPGGNSIGRELPVGTPGRQRLRHPVVIGVVRDIKYSGLDQRPDPAVYVPWEDLPAGHPFLVVRTHGDALNTQSMIRSIVQSVDRNLPLTPFVTLDEAMAHSIADRRLRAMIALAVAVLALAIAVVGLAGTLSRIAAERRRELAIRSSLGATRARILAMLVGEGAALSGVGLVFGVAGSLAAGRALRAFLVGVGPYDLRTLSLVTLLVAAVSVLASLPLARRASRADPLAVLRGE